MKLWQSHYGDIDIYNLNMKVLQLIQENFEVENSSNTLVLNWALDSCLSPSKNKTQCKNRLTATSQTKAV